MDGETYFRFLLMLILVIGMILAIAWVARRFDLGTRMAGGGGRSRRLALVEVMALDSKRRLVLVRRDNKEHLLLIGGGSDHVIESSLSLPLPGAYSSPAVEAGVKRAERTPGEGTEKYPPAEGASINT